VRASIWLQPQDAQAASLSALIAKLAEVLGTVAFAPHLTVCAADAADTWDAAAAHIARRGDLSFAVRKLGVSFSLTTPFRAVAIDIENTPGLRSFREELRRITGAEPFEPPHISLLYTLDAAARPVCWRADATKLRAIAEAAAVRVAVADFVLDRPIVVAPDGDWTKIGTWKIVRSLAPARPEAGA